MLISSNQKNLEMKKNQTKRIINFLNRKYLLLAAAGTVLLQPLSAQQTFTFTTCGATGINGPTQAQANTAYASTNLAGLVTVQGLGIQQWTVPSTGAYRIETYGAQGGT